MNFKVKPIHKYYSFCFLLLVIIVSCANPVAPTGGPKDITPPTVVRSEPGNPDVNFNGEAISITFSEFIALKDINSQLIISPPLKQTPTFQTRGKSLVLKFKDQWLPTTTYNIFFGDAIVDITESNPLGGYKFTFSTGPILDSMMIEGRLINAFDLTPVKGAYVMLYDTIYDSIPYKQIPYYLARTDDSGLFQLTNLRNIPYFMFALTDINANYMYDMPGEQISFIDSLVTPWFNEKHNDIAKADTTKAIKDSSVLVTLPGRHVDMYHFKEVDSTQSLVKTQLLRKNVFSLVFKVPVKEPKFDLVSSDYDKQPITGLNRNRDTLTMWLPGYTADSIFFVVKDGDAVIDTVETTTAPRASTVNTKGPDKVPALVTKSNIQSRRLKPTNPLAIVFQNPVSNYKLETLQLKHDSILLEPKAIEFVDSIRTRLLVRYPWKQGENYTLTMPDSVFTDIMGHSNDSTVFAFKGMTEEETSNVKLDINIPTEDDYIIQLLGDKDKVLEQVTINQNSSIEFKYITPGKYRIKAIKDANKNGYWDTGNYLKRRYPEEVIYYPVELELRANWTIEEEWNIIEPAS